MDEISLKIIKILQKKARIPNVEVARQVNLAPSAVLERIRKLEKQGIIDGYEVRLNPVTFNRDLVAFAYVYTAESTDKLETGTSLSKIPEIQEVHYITGEDCYLIKIRIANTKELHYLLREKISKIKKVTSTKTMVALSTLKETSRIPLRNSDEMEKIPDIQHINEPSDV